MSNTQASSSLTDSRPSSLAPVPGIHLTRRKRVDVVLTKRAPHELDDYKELSLIALDSDEDNELASGGPSEIIGAYASGSDAFYYAKLPDGLAYRVRNSLLPVSRIWGLHISRVRQFEFSDMERKYPELVNLYGMAFCCARSPCNGHVVVLTSHLYRVQENAWPPSLIRSLRLLRPSRFASTRNHHSAQSPSHIKIILYVWNGAWIPGWRRSCFGDA